MEGCSSKKRINFAELCAEEKSKKLFDTLKEAIVEQLGVEEDEVVMEANFFDDLGGDSLDVVEVTLALEEELEIEIPEEDWDEFETIERAHSFLMKIVE